MCYLGSLLFCSMFHFSSLFCGILHGPNPSVSGISCLQCFTQSLVICFHLYCLEVQFGWHVMLYLHDLEQIRAGMRFLIDIFNQESHSQTNWKSNPSHRVEIRFLAQSIKQENIDSNIVCKRMGSLTKLPEESKYGMQLLHGSNC